MMTVFDAFKQVEYTYLEISRGEVYGNRIISEKKLMGVFKDREGMTSSNNQEAYQSSATLHAKPQDYQSVAEVVGNGIRVNGRDYTITGVTSGMNFSDGVLEHYTFTLERASYAEAED